MVQKHWIALGLFLPTVVCFGHVCFCEFLTWDDPLFVTENPHVLTGLTGANIRWAFNSDYGGFVPLSWLSLQLDATLFGPEGAWGFHLTNLLMHVVSVVLFFYLLERMTGELWPSAICAALFAIHPLRVESVAWIAERRDVLSMLLLLVTVAAYCYYAESPGWRRYGIVVICFGLGLAAKQILVTLPFALLLLDYWPLNRIRLGQSAPAAAQERIPTSWHVLILEKVPLLMMALTVSLLTLRHAGRVSGIASQIPWEQRLLVSLAAYLGYLEKTFWPVNLAALYPFQVPSTWVVVLAVTVLLAVTVALIFVQRSKPMLLMGWLWFIGTLLPVSGLIQMGSQGMADRYTYVPHLGLFITVVWGVGGLTVWKTASAPVRRTLVGSTLVILGILSWGQVWHWQTSEKLFRHTLKVTERNPLFHQGLGLLLGKQGKWEEAEYHLALAAQLVPDSAEFNQAYGELLLRQDRNHDALKPMQLAAQLDPENADTHYLLGVVLDKLGRRDEAREQLRKSIECWESPPANGRTPKTRKVSPRVWLCEMSLRDGRPDQVLAQVEQLLLINPDLMEAFRLKGIALGRLERWAEAETALQHSLSLPPHNPTTHGYLAFAYARQNKKDLAAKEYANLLARFPDWLQGTNQFALTRTLKDSTFDPRLAEELALQICEATDYRDPRWLDTLAVAQAAKGAFSAAIQTARKAQTMTADPVLLAQLNARLRLYMDNRALPKD